VTTSLLFFYFFAALALGFALGMVFNTRNTVAAAMCLVVTMLALAGVYLLLDAYLIAALQVMVYAGAIVVLFVFVVMLLNLRSDALPPSRQLVSKGLAVVAGGFALWQLVRLLPGMLPAEQPLPAGFGGYEAVALELFTHWVLPFEVASFLLLAAIVGAVVLAKRRLD
jgi:NADH-quinone oxidoreductase subunit J